MASTTLRKRAKLVRTEEHKLEEQSKKLHWRKVKSHIFVFPVLEET